MQNTRSRRGALGQAVVGYLAKKIGDHPFKEAAENFNRDPVVISMGVKGLEKKISEEETIASAITMLQEFLTKNRKRILIKLNLTPFPEAGALKVSKDPGPEDPALISPRRGFSLLAFQRLTE